MMIKLFWIIIILSFSYHNLCFCFEYSPFTIIVNENDQLSFSCFINRKRETTRWSKYDSDLWPEKLINNTNYSIFPEGKILIKNPPDKHTYYQCALIFDNNFIFEKTFDLVTIGKTSDIYSVFHGELIELIDPLTIHNGLIPNVELKLIWLMWTNHKIYNISIFNDIVQLRNSITVFRLPIASDLAFIACQRYRHSNKIFTCGPSHFIRSAQLNYTLKLLYADNEDTIILRCGKELNDYQNKWYKDGDLMKFGERRKNYGSWIRIENISSYDYGYYECLTQKPSSMPYKLSIFLINFYNSSHLYQSVLSKHEQVPFSLPCTIPDTKTSKKTFRNFHIFEKLPLILHMKNASVNSHMNLYTQPGLSQCLVFRYNRLKIFSNYQIRPQGNNHEPMKPVVLKRRSLDEPSTVLDFKFTAFTDSIKINWSPPATPVKSYTFNWGSMYPGPKKQVIDGKETKFIIESLSPETNYFIKIDTDTINGTVKSILQPVTTKKENKEIVLTIPVNLKSVSVGDTWSRISWDHRDHAQSVNKTIYQVEYYPIRGQMGNKNNLNTSVTVIKITDISPATTYEIMVRSCLINSSKCSDWSMVLEFTTQETKPSDPPQHLTLSTIQLKNVPSDNSLNKHIFAVQVSWQPPKKPNGEIKNYLILVTADKKLDTDNWGERTVSGKTLNTVIDRLDFNRYYYFRIGCSNEYGRSPFSSIRIFKTPDENGKNGGPIQLSKEYYDALEINEELKVQTSNERGSDNLPETSSGRFEKKNKKINKISLTNYKWWIIIGIVVGLTLVFILIILFFVASKCRSDSIPYENGVKVFKAKNQCDMDYRKQTSEVVKFVNKGPILTTPDLFRHTNDQNCHQNYLEMEDRTESPNSFSSNKGFPPQSHNQTFSSQQAYRGIPGHYTPPGLIHQQNIVMTSSQLTSNSNERQFYQVPFLHHMGHNPLNVFTSSAPRVNAASSDFNSINIPSPISGYSDFTSSQATVLYDTSTAKSSGGKSSLSGSGSYNNGLGNKNSLINEPISEGFNGTDTTNELKPSKSSDAQHLISKAFSSEELSQEMANLEGLMKDLNSITQKEFEC